MKNLDMSFLPNRMLCERSSCGHLWELAYRKNCDPKDAFRPALNYWHHNSGDLNLPDGLVVECKLFNYDIPHKGIIHLGAFARKPRVSATRCALFSDYCAVKILGVTPEYKEAGEALGMEVIEL